MRCSCAEWLQKSVRIYGAATILLVTNVFLAKPCEKQNTDLQTKFSEISVHKICNFVAVFTQYYSRQEMDAVENVLVKESDKQK